MIQLRPTCEHCARALPPASSEAMICPNCGGGFAPRPIRPSQDWAGGTGLGHDPASTVGVEKPVDLEAHAALRARLADVLPHAR